MSAHKVAGGGIDSGSDQIKDYEVVLSLIDVHPQGRAQVSV